MTNNESPLPRFLFDPGFLETVYSPERVLVLDYETTGLEKGSALNPENHIVLACWLVADKNGVLFEKYHFGDEYSQAELERDILECDVVVAHNAKFEAQWLKRSGLELRDLYIHDTMMGEWVIGGNRYKLSDLGLSATAKRYGLGSKGNLVSMMIKAGIDCSIIPQGWLLKYCRQDVRLTYELWKRQVKHLKDEGLLHLAHTRNLTATCLADIEFNGSELDVSAVRLEYDKTVEEFQELEVALGKIVGDVNLSSGKQLGVLLYDTLKFSPPIDPKTKEPIKTGKGAFSTTVDTLAKLEAKTPAQREFLDLYKGRNKLTATLTKSLEFFKGVAEEYGGKYYGSFNMGTTQTHRLSASGRPLKFKLFKKARGVQAQNIGRDLKRLFTSHDPDYLIGDADGSALEFRIAAELGDDDVAFEEICNGTDVHQITADTLTKAGEYTERQEAKASTFGPLFGGRGKSPAQKTYAEFFKRKYKHISKMQHEWTLQVLNEGWIRTRFGMIFYWPGTRMSRSGYIDNTTNIYNYPIQSSATAEVIPIALVHFWHRSKDERITIWSTVHDSISSRVHKDDVGIYKDLTITSMTTDVYRFLEKFYGVTFRVPLGVGLKVGTHLGSGQEEKYDVYPDNRIVKVVKK